MSRTKGWILAGVITAIVSFLIMRGMYVIDPMTSYETGYITMFVVIFLNIPLYIMSFCMVVIGGFFLFKDKKKKPQKESVLNHEEVFIEDDNK